MRLSNNSVLITGGSSGIGFAFAERFARARSNVLICGRREDKLLEAADKLAQQTGTAPRTRVCDVARESDRVALFEWATGECPPLNLLVNNAGIQRRVDVQQGEKWERIEQEIAINFEAPVHLSLLFIPHLLKQEQPGIIN